MNVYWKYTHNNNKNDVFIVERNNKTKTQRFVYYSYNDNDIPSDWSDWAGWGECNIKDERLSNSNHKIKKITKNEFFLEML